MIYARSDKNNKNENPRYDKKFSFGAAQLAAMASVPAGLDAPVCDSSPGAGCERAALTPWPFLIGMERGYLYAYDSTKWGV
jgi:hypothetical protein